MLGKNASPSDSYIKDPWDSSRYLIYHLILYYSICTQTRWPNSQDSKRWLQCLCFREGGYENGHHFKNVDFGEVI